MTRPCLGRHMESRPWCSLASWHYVEGAEEYDPANPPIGASLELPFWTCTSKLGRSLSEPIIIIIAIMFLEDYVLLA
jgi:hypothetical protein